MKCRFTTILVPKPPISPSSLFFDGGVEKAYGGKRKIHWMEIYAGQKAFDLFGNWLPDESVEACREYLVSIKGPLTTPIGGGFRKLRAFRRQNRLLCSHNESVLAAARCSRATATLHPADTRTAVEVAPPWQVQCFFYVRPAEVLLKSVYQYRPCFSPLQEVFNNNENYSNKILYFYLIT